MVGEKSKWQNSRIRVMGTASREQGKCTRQRERSWATRNCHPMAPHGALGPLCFFFSLLLAIPRSCIDNDRPIVDISGHVSMATPHFPLSWKTKSEMQKPQALTSGSLEIVWSSLVSPTLSKGDCDVLRIWWYFFYSWTILISSAVGYCCRASKPSVSVVSRAKHAATVDVSGDRGQTDPVPWEWHFFLYGPAVSTDTFTRGASGRATRVSRTSAAFTDFLPVWHALQPRTFRVVVCTVCQCDNAAINDGLYRQYKDGTYEQDWSLL